MANSAKAWIWDRFGFKPIWENFLIRRVPKGPWYAGDGQAMLMLFGIQLVTGVVLAFTYSPTTDSAYPSVQYITEAQLLGWLVRALHYWSGGLWVVLLVYHLFRQILVGGYKSPREGTWLLGVLLMFLVVMTSFIGYVLRWDERAIYGLRVALFHFDRVPGIGDALVTLVQGGAEMSTVTLTRLYAMHVIVIPMILGLLIAYHVYLIVLRGTVTPSETEQPVETAEEQKELHHEDAASSDRGETFYPETPARLSPIPILTLLLVVGLSLATGAPRLYAEANFVERSFPKEEWWFAWYSAAAALLPNWLAPYFYVGFPVGLFLLLVLLPFIDRSPYRGIRKRPLAIAIVTLCLLILLYLTALRQRSPWTAWPSGHPPELPPGILLNERAEQGRQLFVTYGCNSCHAVSGDGPSFAPDLARLPSPRPLDWFHQYVLEPPPGIAMPSYRGRISSEHLALVAEFCHVSQTFPRGE